LRRFPKKEISTVKEEKLSTLFFSLGDKSRFLGDTAKRAPESPTGLDLTHHIIGVDNAELESGCCLGKGNVALGHEKPENNKRKDSSIFQSVTLLFIEIPSTKSETPNKFQYPMVQTLKI